jgi:hypothetical protein
MNLQLLQKIRDNAVKYFINQNIYPAVFEKPTADSVIQYAAYTYVYAIRILQDFGGYSTATADEILTDMSEKAYNILGYKSDIVSNYNGLFLYCMKEIKKGTEIGDNTIEGSTIILDYNAKLLAISLAYLEHFQDS